MKSVIAFAGAAVAMSLDADVQLFNEWKAKHSVAYESDSHELARFQTFKANAAYINSHNMDGSKSYKLGLNKFADMTNEEYKNVYLGSGPAPKRTGSAYLAPAGVTNPDSVDWRTQGYVTPVKDQGQCGSCWAFSTVASLEGQFFKKNGKLESFAEQQLVDCSGSFGNMGCNGGLMDQGFEYIKSLGDAGIDLESSYAYTASDGSCKASSGTLATPHATVTGYTDIREGSEAQLESATATQGPISVAIDASHMSFQFYTSGVYSESECSSSSLDHGVTVVGYGSEDGQNYWLVKNSWGAVWGDQGYIKMTKDSNNQCGIATSASYPLV